MINLYVFHPSLCSCLGLEKCSLIDTMKLSFVVMLLATLVWSCLPSVQKVMVMKHLDTWRSLESFQINKKHHWFGVLRNTSWLVLYLERMFCVNYIWRLNQQPPRFQHHHMRLLAQSEANLRCWRFVVYFWSAFFSMERFQVSVVRGGYFSRPSEEIPLPNISYESL